MITRDELVVGFEEEDDVEVEDDEEWADENDGSDEFLDDVDDVSVSQKGRTAVLTGEIDTEDLTSQLLLF